MLAGIVLVGAVSWFWKVSVHMHCLAAVTVILISLLGWRGLIVGLLLPPLGWARVRLHAHTWAQVIVGAMSGALIPGSLFAMLTSGR